MFDQPFSTLERLWLLGIRLVWEHRERNDAAVRLVDRLFAQGDVQPCGRHILRMLTLLELNGADHLYIEHYDEPGVTGDERDLLRALKACYLDDTLAAEAELGALLPPGRTDAVIGIMQSIATPGARTLKTAVREPLLRPLSTAACH